MTIEFTTDPIGRSYDSILAVSVVALFDENRQRILGSGSFVTAKLVATAHHVIKGHTTVSLRSSDGTWYSGIILPENCFAASDLAFVEVDCIFRVPLALQLLDGSHPTRFRSRGFQFSSDGLSDALPLMGRIGGRTAGHYQAGATSYSSAVLTLVSDGPIESGSSGAPILNTETCGVIGILVSRINADKSIALCIPFDLSLAKTWGRLDEIYNLSTKSGPRFGSAANELGAKSVCSLQCSQSVEGLIASKVFRPDHQVGRVELEDRVASFLESADRILPVVGLSGVGKTSSLCSIALKQAAVRPCVFVRGVDILPGQGGLASLIDEALARLKTKKGMQQAACADDLRVASRSSSMSTLIVLDGLNEATIEIQELRNRWLPASLAWIAGENIQIVVSCRSEYWQLIEDAFPIDSVNRTSTSDSRKAQEEHSKRKQIVWLGDFSPTETRQALGKYSLTHLFTPEGTTYPFLFAIADELRDAPIGSTRGYRALLMLLVHRKISRALGRIGYIAAVEPVLRSLREMAHRMLLSQTQALDESTAEELFGRHKAAVDALLAEHVLIRSANTLRFQFDQIRELLQAESINVETHVRRLVSAYPIVGAMREGNLSFLKVLLHLSRAGYYFAADYVRYRGSRPRIPESATSFGLLCLYEAERIDDFNFLLARLLECCSRDYPFRTWREARSIVALLAHRIPRSLKLADLGLNNLAVLLQDGIHQDEFYNDKAFVESLHILVGKLDLEVREKLKLCRNLFKMESSADWRDLRYRAEEIRRNRVLGKESRLRSKENPLVHLIAEIAQQDDQTAAQVIFSWLSPGMPIRYETWSYGNGPSRKEPIYLSRYAAKLLLLLGPGGAGWLIKSVVMSEAPEVEELAEALTESDPEEMVTALLERLRLGSSSDEARSSYLLWRCIEVGVGLLAQAEVIAYCARLLKSDGHGVGALWASRIVLELYLRMAPVADEDEHAALSAKRHALKSLLPASTSEVARGIVSRIGVEARDTSYLLEVFDEQAVAFLAKVLESDHSENSRIIKGAFRFLRASALRDDPSRWRLYDQVVVILARCFDRACQQTRDAIFFGAAACVRNVGYNEKYYFTDSEVQELGLLKLVLRRLREQDISGFDIGELFGRMNASTCRSVIYAAIQQAKLSRSQRFKFLDTIVSAAEFSLLSFEDILKFRPSVERQWDAVLLRKVAMRFSGRLLSRAAVDYWKRLARGELTEPSREFVFWLELGIAPEEAAMRVAGLSEFGRVSVVRTLSPADRSEFHRRGFTTRAMSIDIEESER